MKELKELHLSGNNFSEGLPDVVSNISTLNRLDLAKCDLTELPERYVEYHRVFWLPLCWKQQSFLTVVFTLLYCEAYSICMLKFINAAFIFGAFHFFLFIFSSIFFFFSLPSSFFFYWEGWTSAPRRERFALSLLCCYYVMTTI